MASELNPPQLDAVRTLKGPLLVLAGAGTGKTRVVTYRIAELIRHRVKPERILAVTFTKKAAGEMQERATALLGRGSSRSGGRGSSNRGSRASNGVEARPEISTFHSLCVRILRRHIRQLGFPEKFVICDRNEQESQARTALRELRAPSASLAPGDLLNLVSRWKSASIRPQQAAELASNEREQLAAAAYRRYQENLKRQGAVDFDDLLLHTEELLTKHPAVRQAEAGRFDQVLIDEYQDTNRSQYEIVRALAGGHRNLCVVGDDDQSIYGWRGAEVTHILRFKQDWPEAKIVRLEDNYRSSAAILHYANTLIAFNRQRHEKVLKAAKPGGARPTILQCQDETQEALRVVADIRQAIDGKLREPNDIAILCRTNEQPRSFETELRRANVPYVLIGGMSFFDRREVRDILSYLKVIENPHDEPALMRILNQPARGIGNAAQKRLVEEATTRGQFLWEVLPDALVIDGVDARTASCVQHFRHLIEELRRPQERIAIAALAKSILDRTGYRDHLVKEYPDAAEQESRLASLEEIINAAANHDKKYLRTSAKSRKAFAEDPFEGSLATFLDDMLLNERDDSEEKESQLARNAVALMTLHSAKGLEFPSVYLVGMEEGILPHKRSVAAVDDASIDEERRLCYVGVTRAQEQLTLSFALTRRKWGKPQKTIPSRFLYEMTGQAENFPPKAEPEPPKKGKAKSRSPRGASNRKKTRR
ncbi:MAG: UvrD-helicase domain-containing protein [Pirellulales bacterium]|nr:UvrD-helicase domain-containing protein [Pirellulales bacterium]